MLKMILGIIAGFVVWSFLWVGSHALFGIISPDWYGKIDVEFMEAVTGGADYTVDSTILFISLIRSVIFSIIAGYLTAFIAKENVISTIILGILLLLVGILVQIGIWRYEPIWYHLSFLILLIPMTILGGKLKKD
jgi:hypothetical protein